MMREREREKRAQQPPQVVRTIYMPNESVDVLKLQCEALSTQLREQVCGRRGGG